MGELLYKLKEFKGYVDSNKGEYKDNEIKRSFLSPSLNNYVKERDNFSCFLCGSEENLEAHHIMGFTEYPFLSIYPENQITLCHKCHREYHNKNKEVNSVSWSKYLRDLKDPVVKTVKEIKEVEVYPKSEELINNDRVGTIIHTIRHEEGRKINHGKLISIMEVKYNIPYSETERIIKDLLNRGTIHEIGGEYYLKQ